MYAAYNRGLDEAHTPYVMVMGCNNLLLPGLDNVLSTIPVERRPDMIAAQTLMQDGDIAAQQKTVGAHRPELVPAGYLIQRERFCIEKIRLQIPHAGGSPAEHGTGFKSGFGD